MSGESPKTRAQGLTLLAAAGLAVPLAVLSAATALGQPAPTFPASRALPDISAWLKRDTPVSPDQVVDLNTASVTAIVSATVTKPQNYIVTLRSEALDPSIGSENGILSWEIPVEVDCANRRVRLGSMTGFPGREFQIAPRTMRPADTDWVNPSPRAPMGSVLQAVCEPSFQKPFGGPFKLAAVTAPSKPPTAAPAQKASPPPAPAVVAKAAAPPPTPKAAPPAAAPVMRGPVTASAGGGSVTIQIGASSSQAEIKSLLAKVQGKFVSDLSGLSPSVATVTVDQKTVYRGLFSGLKNSVEATKLCEKLQAAGQGCFIRR